MADLTVAEPQPLPARVYPHPFDTDDHADAMAALDALDKPVAEASNVIRFAR